MGEWQNAETDDADMPSSYPEFKSKCHFECTKIPFFGEMISRGVQPDSKVMHTNRNAPINK